MHEITAPPFTLAHRGMWILVQRGPVIICQRISVHGKMDGHKIQDDADLILMACVHKRPELIRCPIPGGGAEKSGSLIPPRLIARVFAQRHDLQIIIPAFFQVRDQDIRHLLVIIPGIRLF